MEKKNIKTLIDIGVKSALAFLPAPISAAFNAIIDNTKENVLNKRIEKWKEEVIQRISNLEVGMQELTTNDSFATALIKTSELAIKTQSDEKRKILADALINSYVSNLSEDKIIIFLQLIEKYSTLHIGIIKYLHNVFMNEYFSNNHVPTFLVLLRLKFPESDDAYLKKAVNDLRNDNVIVDIKDDSYVMFWNHRFDLMTKLGNDFYDYIKATGEKES